MKYGKVIVMSEAIEFEVETDETGQIVEIRFRRCDLEQAIQDAFIHECRSAGTARPVKHPSETERERIADTLYGTDRSIYGDM